MQASDWKTKHTNAVTCLYKVWHKLSGAFNTEHATLTTAVPRKPLFQTWKIARDTLKKCCFANCFFLALDSNSALEKGEAQQLLLKHLLIRLTWQLDSAQPI